MATKSKELSFEQQLGELESLVAQLESGELPLEQALKHFERGIQLTRECQTALEAARQKVQILMQKDGQTELAPFAPDTGEE